MASPVTDMRDVVQFNLKIETLIKEVHYRPAIWNKSSERYSDRRLKARMWEEVCENVIVNWKKLNMLQKNAICGEIQKKWRNVKDAYKKEVQVQKKISAGQEVRRKRQYIHFNALSFLTNEVNNTSSTMSLDESDDESDNTSMNQENACAGSSRKKPRNTHRDADEELIIIKREKFNFDEECSDSEHNKQNTDDNEKMETELERSDFQEDNANFAHKNTQHTKEYPDRRYVEKCDEWESEAHSEIDSKKEQINNVTTVSDDIKVYDEVINFTEMMVPMLRKLNDDQKHFAKIEILNILHKARRYQPSLSTETQTEEI